MILFFQEIGLQLFLWLLMLVDGIMEIFSAIAGIMTINYNGENVNLIEFVIGNSTVNTVFWCIFILAVGLSAIFAITALIKNMIVNNRTVSTIVGKFFLSLLGTMAMLVVVLLGIMIANSVLMLIAEIFELENTTKLSNALFNGCVGDWLNGYSINEINVTSLTVRDILGDYNTAALGIWPTSWKCNGMVDPNTFLYLPALIAGIALTIAMIVAIMGLAKRVYELVFLYLVMPMSMSTLSVDDGARFKIWRETFITKIVLAYGAVFSVNIFVLILPLLSSMRIDGISNFGNSMFLLFMIIGGAMVIPAGMNLFARLFGNPDDHVGGSFLHSVFYGGRIAGALTFGLAAKIIRGTYRLGKKIRERKSGGSDNSSDEQYADTTSADGEEGGDSE